MGNIYIGNKALKNCYIGNRQVKAIYVGLNKVWQKSSPYTPITPLDTATFPATLNGFYAEPLTGLASGASSSYVGSVYGKPWLTQNAKKLGKAYSSIGNGVPSFSDYQQGTLAVGYSADSAASGTKALNVWCFDYKPTAAEANTWIDAQDSTILYELFTDDGSVWKAAMRDADSVFGYWNQTTDVFVPVKGMTDAAHSAIVGQGEAGK